MRMIDEITLRHVITTTNERGFKEDTAVEKTIFADAKSVKRSEYYAAQAAGMEADIVFNVLRDEYSGQSEIEYLGERYEVTRTYEPRRGYTELTCAKAVVT